MTDTTPSTPRRRRLAALAVAVLAGLGASASAAYADPSKDPVQRRLDGLVASGDFPGALAYVRTRDGRVHRYKAGVANLETRTPVPVNGRIRIGSNTKTFTATVVLQLVGEGKVDLDAPIERYLPGVVRGEGIDGNAITVRELLQHTSGIPDYDETITDLLDLRTKRFTPMALVQAGLGRPATFAPGTGWSYSNTNYALLGMLVERVTRRPIGEEVTARIIKPLGLTQTSWPSTGDRRIRGRHAHGYFRTKPTQRWTDVTRVDMSFGWAAGALISTPHDTSRFFRALVDGEVLRPQELAQMQRTVVAPGVSAAGTGRYGLGLQPIPTGCKGAQAWGHGGDVPGFETRNAVSTDGREAFVAVTALPTTLAASRKVERVLEAALCR